MFYSDGARCIDYISGIDVPMHSFIALHSVAQIWHSLSLSSSSELRCLLLNGSGSTEMEMYFICRVYHKRDSMLPKQTHMQLGRCFFFHLLFWLRCIFSIYFVILLFFLSISLLPPPNSHVSMCSTLHSILRSILLNAFALDVTELSIVLSLCVSIFCYFVMHRTRARNRARSRPTDI